MKICLCAMYKTGTKERKKKRVCSALPRSAALSLDCLLPSRFPSLFKLQPSLSLFSHADEASPPPVPPAPLFPPKVTYAFLKSGRLYRMTPRMPRMRFRRPVCIVVVDPSS